MRSEETFKQAMQTAGIETDAAILADGALHRFHVSGDRTVSKNGWYVLHSDDPAAGQFGCFKRGISETWSGKAYTTLATEEKARYTAKMEAARRQRDEETAKLQAECRTWCAERWQHSKEAANTHPYLKRKGVHAYGLRLLHDSLMVPLYDTALTIHGMQFIGTNGDKKFKVGTAKQGHYYPIGKPKDKTLLVCEGYATGASLHEATGYGVAIAFDAGNLKPVAEALRQKYPDYRLIVCADNDQWSDINTGVIKATEAALAVAGMLTIADIQNTTDKPTDFNDLHRVEGIEAVRRQVEQAGQPRQDNGKVAAESSGTTTKEKPLPFSFRRMSDIQAKPIRWLWPGRIARGKVAMLAGHPGLGKSQLTSSLAAIVTAGGTWPVDRTPCEQGNVVFFSAEDDAEDTIRPRLEAAGADLDRVFILDAVLEEDGTRPRAFNMSVDLPRLGQMLEHIGDVALIVIDPITAYLGGTDSHKNADMRALLSLLADLAAKYGVAVVCVSHLNKGGSGEALMRVTGSLAFVAAARAAFLIARDKEDKHRRLFLPIKNNIGNDESGLAFCVESHTLSGGIETSRISWEAEAVSISADEAMAPQGDPEERSALDDAKEFLNNLLAEGPVSNKQIRGDAEGAGIAWRTIQRAQKALGIEAYKGGMKGGWLWKLPAKSANDHEECQQNTMAAFGKLGNLQHDTSPVYPDNGGVPEFTEDDLQTAGWV
jgi:putative DNA primase/helicase